MFKKFWKNFTPFYSNEIKSKEGITLTENDNIISNDKKAAETFHKFFNSHIFFMAHLKLTQSHHPLKKSLKHPGITNIENRMIYSNFTFSFKFETQEKFLKLIQNLKSNKATQQYEIPIKVLKENNEICSCILYHNFNKSLFSKFFSNSLKKADIIPVFKKDEELLKNNLQTF